MIIGISGTFGSGKDSLSEYLSNKYNLLHISTSDIVREVARTQYNSIDRPILFKVANQLRKDYGSAIMIDKSLEKYNNLKSTYDGLLVSAIRTTGEANKISKIGGQMLFVDAPIRTRYQRIVSRQRDEEAKISFDDFKKREKTESNSNKKDDVQDLNAVKDMCSIVIINDKSKEDFYKIAEKALNLA